MIQTPTRVASLRWAFGWSQSDGSVFLLDTYTGSAGAWSLRRLRTAYTGQCVRLRRASDNVESDFGFAADGWVDQTSIAAWVGASSAFVVTLYDQSGNGRDMTQATAARQPSWSASVASFNGRPGVTFDASQTQFLSRANDVLTGTSAATILAIAYRDGTQALRVIAGFGTSTNGARLHVEAANTGQRGGASVGGTNAFSANDSWPVPAARAVGARVGGGNVSVLVDNAVSNVAASNPTYSNVMASIGRIPNGTGYMQGSVLEVIAWNNNTVDWLAIHADQRGLRS